MHFSVLAEIPVVKENISNPHSVGSIFYLEGIPP